MKFSLPATLLLVAASAWAQQSPPSAADDVQNYSLKASGFIDALLQVSAHFRLPLGVEWIKSADTLKPIQLTRTRTTVTDIIQAIVSMQAEYDWRTEDGVVHVFQRNLMEDGRNPLNITIQSFGETPETVGWANNELFQMVDHTVRHPEFSSGFVGSVLGGPDEPVFRFGAESAPARSILNEFVRAGLSAAPARMKRVWIATFPETPVFSHTGFLEVAPMLNPKVVSDDNQPFWSLLPWGDPPLQNMVR